jgi:hypothetical protein
VRASVKPASRATAVSSPERALMRATGLATAGLLLEEDEEESEPAESDDEQAARGSEATAAMAIPAKSFLCERMVLM